MLDLIYIIISSGMSRTIRVWLIEVRGCTGEGSCRRYSRGIYVPAFKGLGLGSVA